MLGQNRIPGYLSPTTDIDARLDEVEPSRVVILATTGGDTDDLATAISLASALVPTPSATDPAAIIVYPGVFTVTAKQTLPANVDLFSVGGPEATIIQTTLTTDAVIECRTLGAIFGIQCRNADGVGGIGFNKGTAGLTNIYSCIVRNCTTGYVSTGGSVMFARDSMAQRLAGQTLTTGFRAEAASQMHGWNSQAPGTPGDEIGTGFVADGAGAINVAHCCGTAANTVALYAVNGGLMEAMAHHIGPGNVTSRRIGLNGTMNTSGTIGIASTNDILVDGTGATITIFGGEIREENVTLLSDTLRAGFSLHSGTDNESARALIDNNTSIGTPTDPHMLAVGEGLPNSVGMEMFTFDTSAPSGSKFVDITAAAKSRTGSTFTFPASTTVGDAIVFGSLLMTWGIRSEVSTAMSLDGVLDWDYWDGGAWVEMPPADSRGSGILVHGASSAGNPHRANNAWEVVENQRIHWNDEITGLVVADDAVLDEVPTSTDGLDRFWFRARIATDPTTEPILQQLQGLYSSVVSSVAGVVLHGTSRSRQSFTIFTTIFEGGQGPSNPKNKDLSYSTSVGVGMKRNSYEDGSDMGVTLLIPFQFSTDTSSPQRLKLIGQASNTDTGDAEFVVTYGVAKSSDNVDTSLPGPLPEFSESVIIAGPGVVGDPMVFDFDLRSPQANVDDGDQLFILIQRDATGGNPSDDYTGDVHLRAIELDDLVWRIGQPGM